MKTSKRILSVTIKRMVDSDPDTSYLGEYSNRATSDYSIDRAHSEDCASLVPVNKEYQSMLVNARAYVADLQSALPDADSQEWQSLEDAYFILDGLSNDMDQLECECGGNHVSFREYRYFNLSFNYVDKSGKPSDGLTPEEVRKYVRQDYERMERLNAGDWCYLGMSATAEVATVYGGKSTLSEHVTTGGSGPVQTIHSGRLWGIESDSDRTYLESVQKEELENLKTELLALGFSRRAIATAFKSIKEVSE